MKEALFILLVVCILAALTAIKYRKQISGMLGVVRVLKEVKQNISQSSVHRQTAPEKSVPLVNCSKCGVWVPQNKAIKMGDVYYCSQHA